MSSVEQLRRAAQNEYKAWRDANKAQVVAQKAKADAAERKAATERALLATLEHRRMYPSLDGEDASTLRRTSPDEYKAWQDAKMAELAALKTASKADAKAESAERALKAAAPHEWRIYARHYSR